MKAIKVLVTWILALATYIVFTGSTSTYSIVTGIVVALVIAFFMADILVENPLKVFNPIRWLWLNAYALYYFFIAEVRAHLDVMYRILHPSMPVKPAIVEVPYSVNTNYAITAIANSITNTPGTVVVDIDEKNKKYYVHWIYAKSIDPLECRKAISSVFEKYVSKIFE